MKRAVLVMLLAWAVLAGAALVSPQPGLDPWWRPHNPQGQSEGITYGLALPTDPADGEVGVDMNGAGDGGAIAWIYDMTNAEYDYWLNLSAAGTVNYVPKFEAGGTSLTDSQTIRSVGVPAANTDGSVVDIPVSINSADAGNVVNILLIDVDSPATHDGAVTINGIHIDNDVATAAGIETALFINDAWDWDIHFEAADSDIGWFETGSLTIQDYGGSHEIIFEDVPDLTVVDATVALVELDQVLGILDAGDIVEGLFIDITNAVHTGGFVYGLHLDDIVASAATEIGVLIGTGWDTELRFLDTTNIIHVANNSTSYFQDTGAATTITFRDVPAAGTANDLIELDQVLSAMDGAGDTFRSFYIDVTNADHTAGTYVGIGLDLSANDADAYETGIYVNGGFDGHLTLEAAAASPADNPPSGTIGLYIDDQTDWSGAGGNDCALIARDSSGATDVIATLVLNGACP